MADRWTAVALDDVEAVPWRGTELVWRPLRGALGTRVAGMGAYTAERAGQEVVEGHTEAGEGRGHEEVYVVLRGRATFALDGEELDAPAGTFLCVRDPAVHRRFGEALLAAAQGDTGAARAALADAIAREPALRAEAAREPLLRGVLRER